MTITFEQAVERAKAKLEAISQNGIELRILGATVDELTEGWVFGYETARFLETGQYSDRLAGNIPLFVSRVDGTAFLLSQHRPLQESLAAYLACGDPNATLTREVELTGWTPGANVVAAIQKIRLHCPVGLVEAKNVIDRCLSGERPVVAAVDVDQAKVMIASLASVGFRSRVRYDH